MQAAVQMGDVQRMFDLSLLRLGALLGTLLAIKHIGSRHVVFAGAHQRQLDLILDVFDMYRAALRLTAHQRVHHVGGELLHHFAYTGGTGGLAAVDSDERLGYGDGDLGRLERDDGAVTAHDFI